MLDFNNEEHQKDRNYGPVPAGSKVLCGISLEKPRYSIAEHDYVSSSKSGLRGLWVKITVISGTYEGVSWYENLWLPAGFQKISLNEGQMTACNMAGAKLRAIIEASRGIDPSDTGPQASRKRTLSDWLELSGMEFPARLGIGREPYEKDGKIYWNNVVGKVITPGQKEYAELMNGGEIITDGPTTGDGKTQAKGNGSSGNNDGGFGGFPPSDAYDEVPF